MNLRDRIQEPRASSNFAPIATDSSKTLTGWKAIARYMDRGVRTVQRYERDLALPVRRPACKYRGSVLATTHDLDEWIKNSPVREEDHDTAPSITVTAEAGVIRANIAEMHRLRVQMSVLRNELHESLRRLQYRIDELGDTAPREEPASEHLVLALLEGPPAQTYQMLKVAHRRKAS